MFVLGLQTLVSARVLGAGIKWTGNTFKGLVIQLDEREEIGSVPDMSPACGGHRGLLGVKVGVVFRGGGGAHSKQMLKAWASARRHWRALCVWGTLGH